MARYLCNGCDDDWSDDVDGLCQSCRDEYECRLEIEEAKAAQYKSSAELIIAALTTPRRVA